MTSKVHRALAAALVLLSFPALAAVEPQGRELRVNRRIDFKQLNPAVAFAPGGGALIAWENDQRGIRALPYGDNGWPSGPEVTLVESEGAETLPYNGPVMNPRQPAVAFLGNGQFLLAWTKERGSIRATYFYERREIDDQDVFVQRFSSAGSPLGAPMRLNTTAAGMQREPRLVARGGGFFAVWEDGGSGGIAGRALDATGAPVGSEIKVSERAGTRPALAANKQGKVLVVWQGTDDSEAGVFARLLDSSAVAVGGEVRINTDTEHNQSRPAVAADRAGNFLVAWQGERPELWPGFYYLYGQAISADGARVGPQVRLYQGNLTGTFPQIAPALAATPAGHFLLTWLTWKTPNDFYVAGVEVDTLGKTVGEAFWITESRAQISFRRLAAACDETGRALVTWEKVAERRQGINARKLKAD